MSPPLPPELAPLLPVFAALFGLTLGSFLNVLVYRLPLGRSVVFPRSRCPACGEAIAAYDNVPVLSYLLLRGRCRRCRVGISPRYPAVELAGGAVSLVAYLRHGPTLEYAVELFFLGALVALVLIDFDHRLLPDAFTLPGTAAGLLLSGPRETISLPEALGGALAGAGLLYLVAKVYLRLRKIEGLGMGDVKLMAMVGAFLGWKAALLTVFFGSFLGSLVGIGLLILQRGSLRRTELPFGTFLGAGAAFSLLAGRSVLEWYGAFW